mmetsp:Transcript_48106/g.89639  ORF Transcript_48106/g.89639 Transcript_48106/m.89639 type:complete len:452 (-) Transcript_48106:217-1572(-)
MLNSILGFDPFEDTEQPRESRKQQPWSQADASVAHAQQGSAGFPAHMSASDAGPLSGEGVPTPGGYSLVVDVDCPQRSSGMMPYIQYRVRCNTNMPSFLGSQHTVWRRYSDFEWLHTRLKLGNPGVIVPPIPEKTVLSFDDPEHSVIVERVFMLKWFLQQVAAHPALCEGSDLRIFVESTSSDLQDWYERGYMGEALAGASSYIGSLTTSVKDSTDKPMVALTDMQIEKMYPCPPWDIDDDALIKYLSVSEESLYTLCLTTEKIADQHDEQARALFALANGLTQMGNAEDKTTDVIAAWALETGAANSKMKLNVGGFGTYMRDYLIGSYKEQGPQINFFLYLALKKGYLLTKAAKEMVIDHKETLKARKHAIMHALTRIPVLDFSIVLMNAWFDRSFHAGEHVLHDFLGDIPRADFGWMRSRNDLSVSIFVHFCVPYWKTCLPQPAVLTCG